MKTENSILSQIEPDEDIPVFLMSAILSEIDTVRSSTVIINHFTENLAKSLVSCLALASEKLSSNTPLD